MTCLSNLEATYRLSFRKCLEEKNFRYYLLCYFLFCLYFSILLIFYIFYNFPYLKKKMIDKKWRDLGSGNGSRDVFTTPSVSTFRNSSISIFDDTTAINMPRRALRYFRNSWHYSCVIAERKLYISRLS